MADIVFEEIECRSAVHRVQAADLPFRWAANPYRAGAQPCGYCAGDAEGASRVVVKVNTADALRRDLARPEWRRETVAIGTACEPYHAAELRYSLTHRLLKVLRDAANPATLFTRSVLVARDADVLVELAAAADVSVVFPMATLDDELRRRIEPASDPVDRRLRAMEQLATAGVRCGVLLAPVAPGLTDDPAGLGRVVEAARSHGASFLHPNVLYLRPGTREWSMPLLREAYPHLVDRYAADYRGPHGARTFTQDVHRMIDELRERFGLARAAEVSRAGGQLQLAM
ncbi:MAG: radical SAM protein [Dehalococcoidia bacterium]|nr:MAG: radical SAM protein [Dehalococcoidia bacterium]